MRTIPILLLAALIAGASIATGQPIKATDIRCKSAFLLGMADSFEVIGPWARGDVRQTDLRTKRFIELANLVEISDITTKANPQEPSDWSRKVEALITRIEYPPFDTDEWYRIWRGESPEGWDRDCYWSYLLGSYCGSGRLQEIGPLSSRRAFFIAAVILRLDSGCGVKVETSLNYTPGGSCVKIPDGTLRDRLISEAHALLEPRNTEANQTLQRTPGTESFPSTESDPRRL